MQIRPLTERIGAEVSGVDVGAIDDASLLLLRGAWRERLVLVIRDQTLAPDALVGFARRLGTLDPAPPFDTKNSALESFPELAVVSNVRENGVPIGGLGAGELNWHSDMTYRAQPPVACALYARELPPSGGDTSFLSLVDAFDSLPGRLRDRVVTRRAWHDSRFTSAGTMRMGAEDAGTSHALVEIEPVSGRNVLLLGRQAGARIEDEPDGTLLEQLWTHVETRAATYTHRWRTGDLLLWANLGVMHRRSAFDEQQRRLLWRAQIASLAA
jgi:taurine dioxygenase